MRATHAINNIYKLKSFRINLYLFVYLLFVSDHEDP